MLVSINWLRDYADIDVPVEEFCDRMILSGSNIETVEPYGTKFSKIVVGRILKSIRMRTDWWYAPSMSEKKSRSRS